jgi:predicted porin
MNLKIILIIFFTTSCLSLHAKSTVYGKLWISVESQKSLSGNELDMESNASRVGIKGSLGFREGLEAIYQVEYEVDLVDGKVDELKGSTFKRRNSFIGVKGFYGTIFLGTHDTSLKDSQKKIDLFNDLAADIKTILRGENRMNNLIGFITPTSKKGISVTFNTIKGSTESVNNSARDSTSVSLNYKTKSLYASISIDSKVKGYDNTRLSLQVPFNRTQLGIIYQDTKKLSTGIKEDGYVISMSRKVGDKGTFKVQLAESAMKLDSGKQTSFGYDYQLSKKAKAFFFFTDLSGNKKLKEKDITAVGFEYKF